MPPLTEANKSAVARSPRTRGDVPAVPLGTMLGDGVYVMIEGARYEVAPVPLSKLRAFGEVVNRCPQILVTHALAGIKGGQLDVTATADLARRVAQQNGADEANASKVDEVAMLQALCMGTLDMSDDEVDATAELVALVLKRKHPDVTADDFRDTLDIPGFLAVLLTAFLANPALADRFSQPAQPTAI